jgi:hypothetical protein
MGMEPQPVIPGFQRHRESRFRAYMPGIGQQRPTAIKLSVTACFEEI